MHIISLKCYTSTYLLTSRTTWIIFPVKFDGLCLTRWPSELANRFLAFHIRSYSKARHFWLRAGLTALGLLLSFSPSNLGFGQKSSFIWIEVKKKHRIMKLNGVGTIGNSLSLLSLGKSTLNELKLPWLPVNKKVTISNLVTRLWCIESKPETDVDLSR